MAIYQLEQAVLLFPFQYEEGTGKEATHLTKDEDKAVNERGKPKTEYASIRKSEGRLLYETKTDFDKLTEEEQHKAFYVSDKAALKRYLGKNALSKLER